MIQKSLYHLHPRQREAMVLLGWGQGWRDRSGAVTELLYGGAAGGGKSHLIRAVAATIAIQYPGSIFPIFRRSYKELEENMIRKWLFEVPENHLTGRWHETRREFRWHNGSITEFRYCENEGDVRRYLSAEWDGMGIDEAGQFTEFMISMLRSRVRSLAERNWTSTIVYGTNPGGPGHAFLKQHFVDEHRRNQGQPWMAMKEHGGQRRAFLLSKLDDNPSLDEASYGAMLDGISDPVLREAMRDGNWDTFLGQFFTNWGYELHTCEPFQIPKSWRCWAALDWGHAKPLSYGVWTQHPDTDRVYKARELYRAGMSNKEACEAIKETAGDLNPNIVLADPSMWIKNSQTGISNAEDYANLGVTLTPANNDRINGWQVTRGYFTLRDDGLPGMQIFRNCLNTIRTVPLMEYDPNRPEDMNTKLEDHAADEMRYALTHQVAATAEMVTSFRRKQGWQRRR